jgi:uncharacterized protein (UPF0333 family)
MTRAYLKTICTLAALVAAGLAAVPAADASRKATASEAKAIKKAFFKGRSKAATRISSIRVSTVNKRYSAVSYSTDVKVSTFTKAPTPVVFKKGTKAWAKVATAKVPAKVKKDLKKKDAKSNIQITGELTASLTRGATCSSGGVNIYDPAQDILLSMQLFTSKGPGTYDALGTGTVVGIYRNSGTELAYESGQPTDAQSSSGFFHIDAGRWGIIDADLGKPPTATAEPLSVFVKGTFDCR